MSAVSNTEDYFGWIPLHSSLAVRKEYLVQDGSSFKHNPSELMQ